MKLRLVPNPMYKASKLSKERHDRDECRIRIERTLYELNQKYREYKLDPQLHPNYSEYWIAYWRRNRTAIKYANKSSIDIKKEWCKIFKPIMDKIHKAQIVCIKLEYKKKLKLSTKSCDKNKKRYEELTTRRQRSPVLISDDSEDYHRKPTKRSRVDPPIKGQVSKATCTITSGSLTDDVPDKDEETSPNEAFYGKYCPKLLAAKLQPFKPSEANDDDPITLKIVCRLFIDLDVNMGKLPSFMLMIFVQCLFLEIKEIRSIDEILLTNFNCWILNAVMHGLQNLIELNFMPKIKVAAAKRLIIKISILIQRGIIRALIDAQQPEHPILPTNPFECYDGTDYDNLDLSDKVTVGLASKGETKITKDDIANLINNFKKCRQLNDDEDDQVNPENDDEDYNEPEAKARDFTASTLPQVNLPELVNNDDKIANLIQQVRAQCAEHSLEKMTDNNLQQLTRKFKTLPEKIQNLLLSNKFEDFSKITALCKSINIEPVEIRIQQLTVAPEEIARSLNHAPLAHVHFDLAPDAFQVEELVQEIMQFENIAQVLLRDDDEEEVSGDDNSEVQIVENETPEPVEIIDDSDDDALEVEDTDDEAAEPIEILDSDDEISEIVKLDEEAFMVSDEELDDGSVENQYEQEVQGSDREQDSDTDMEEADSDSDSDQMDTDEENDSDMDGQDDRMDDDSDDEPAHEPTHEPEDEPDDDVDQEPAEEQPDVEEAEQPPAEDIDEQPPAGEQVDQAAGEQNPAPQAKEASKDSGGESDEDQPKESHRNYEYDSVDDGYDDAEVIAKMINLRTFEGPPKQPQSFEMPLPSTSAPPKSLLYSLQNNMRKAFNAPESSNDYCNRVCQLECNMETAKKLNYPYQNLTPIFRCKKPRFEEFNPNMFNNFNASIDSAQRHIALTKANDMYFHQLHSKDDNAQEPGIKRNKRR